MARRPGDRNRDYEQKRALILDALQGRLLQEDAAQISMNEMAEVAGVSLSTLRHHLGDRSELLAAVLARHGALGAPHLASLREEPAVDLDTSIRGTMHGIVIALENGLAEILANGLMVGLRQPVIGPSFLNNLLEPVQQALELRLERHLKKGELLPCDLRIAALSLIAPVLLAGLHQRGLGGCRLRPLELHGLVDGVVDAFLRAYAAPAGQ